jgi:hypothetical protein
MNIETNWFWDDVVNIVKKEIIEPVVNFVEEAGKAIVEVVTTVVNHVVELGKTIFNAITSIFSAAIQWLLGKLIDAINALAGNAGFELGKPEVNGCSGDFKTCTIKNGLSYIKKNEIKKEWTFKQKN